MPVDMMVPTPELRKVNTQILSDLGWLQGTFHVPQHQALMDFFASGVHLMKCTRVRLPGQKELIPFLAIRREMVALVQPTLPDELVEAPGSIGRTMPRKVECFLLQESVFHPYGVAADSAQIRRMPLAIVNTARTLGVAEHDAGQ
jgi:hypothetical protein